MRCGSGPPHERGHLHEASRRRQPRTCQDRPQVLGVRDVVEGESLHPGHLLPETAAVIRPRLPELREDGCVERLAVRRHAQAQDPDSDPRQPGEQPLGPEAAAEEGQPWIGSREKLSSAVDPAKLRRDAVKTLLACPGTQLRHRCKRGSAPGDPRPRQLVRIKVMNHVECDGGGKLDRCGAAGREAVHIPTRESQPRRRLMCCKKPADGGCTTMCPMDAPDAPVDASAGGGKGQTIGYAPLRTWAALLRALTAELFLPNTRIQTSGRSHTRA